MILPVIQHKKSFPFMERFLGYLRCGITSKASAATAAQWCGLAYFATTHRRPKARIEATCSVDDC
jgi:hypothetical protein